MPTGIIVEYNPMHLGHIHHANAARADENDTVIAVMSGWFVQRGEPAIADPYIRAQTAVDNGVDLVFLLPLVHSIQSAQYYAQGAVDLLALAGVDRIVYGAAHPDITETKTTEKDIQRALRSGRSYASAVQHANSEVYLDANTRLGLCYRAAAKKRGYNIRFDAILRAPWPGTNLPAERQNATAIRTELLAGRHPAGLAAPLSPPYPSLEDYFDILTHLILFPREDPARFPYFEKGLDDRLRKTRTGAETMEEWIERARSKRHTGARIRRFLVHLLLGLAKEQWEAAVRQKPDALVPLALNEKGRAHLRTRKEDILILSTRKALGKYCDKNDTPYRWDLLARRMYQAYIKPGF